MNAFSAHLPRDADFPHVAALVPAGHALDEMLAAGLTGLFRIDAGCGHDAANSSALAVYFEAKRPIVVCAARARDLRPVMRRATRRGYTVEMMPPDGDWL